MAMPEKSLIDFFYLYPAKSHLFRALPELELPGSFKIKKAFKIIDRIKPPKRRNLVESLFEKFIYLGSWKGPGSRSFTLPTSGFQGRAKP